jgi:enoyl-CoA hydratase
MQKSGFETIIFEQGEGYAKITINRPKVLNALNETVLEEIHEALLEEVDPEKTRIIILQGAGGKAFAAGADIAPMSELTPDEALDFARAGQALTVTMEAMAQIFIAKVDGFALGGGCELAMACDLILASEHARFGQPEVNLGLIPGFGGTQRLVKRVGLPVAMDLILCGQGRTLKAEEALKLGLVSRVVPQDQLETELNGMIKSILAAGPMAVAEAKLMVRQGESGALVDGLNAEATAFAMCFAREESAEGMKAFLEKRKAKFDW